MTNLPLGNYQSNVSSIQQGVQYHNNPPASVDFGMFNSARFFELMANIDNIQKHDMFNIIKNYIDVIVDRTLSDDKNMAAILSHKNFVDPFYDAIKTIPIDFERRLFCNKITYEYGIIDNIDQSTLTKFKEISSYVNASTVNELVQTGLPKRIAEHLAVCRFSSRHENTNVQRLNFAMGQYSCELFTEQMCIWVYERLFDRISDLFIYSMLEVYSEIEFDDMSSDFRDIYGAISLAILKILNNMPKMSIRQVLLKYIDAYESWYSHRRTKPRFSLRAISNEYENVVDIVDHMIDEGYQIP